ncbi:MAG: phage holin family protein [Chitinivibrionales bacterium]|nr:phage holin family protein [Chitinivibrionales bacterium]
MSIIINILVLSIAIFLVAQLMPAITIKNFGTAIVVAIVYGLLSFFFGWLLFLISLPVIIITFGLFKFVINAVLLWLTDKLIDDFEIKSFPATLLAAFLITIIDAAMKWIIR